MPTLALTGSDSVTAEFSMTGHAADGTVEVQVAIRPDFKFCVSPILTGIPRDSTMTLSRLNQGTSFYVRARARRASGVAEAWSVPLPFYLGVATPQVTTPSSIMISPATLVVPVPVTVVSAFNVWPGYPPENLFIDAPVAWRSPHPNAHQLNIRMAREPIDTIALLMHNLPEDAQISIYVGTTPAVGDASFGPFPARASANLRGRPGYHSLMRLPAPIAYEYWRVGISAICPGGLMHIEHAVFGLNRMTKNVSTDKSETSLDLGSLDRLRSGNPNRVQGYRMRRVDFDLSALTEAQYETQYGDLHWRVGGTDPVLVVPNSKPGFALHDRILYGAITAGRVINTHSPWFSRNFTIDSLI